MTRSKEEIVAERNAIKMELAAMGGPYPKGVSGNPGGRMKGSRNKSGSAQLKHALEDFERGNVNANIFTHFVERAFDNDAVLLGIMKKLVPDLKAVMVMQQNDSNINPELADVIKEKFCNIIDAKVKESKPVSDD